MKKSAIIGTALLSAATVAAGIGMIALPHAYASWEWRGYRGDLNHDAAVFAPVGCFAGRRHSTAC